MTATPKGVMTQWHEQTGILRANRKQIIMAFYDRGITVRTANRKIDEMLAYGILFPVESTLPDGHEIYSCIWWLNPAPKIVEQERLKDEERAVMVEKGLVKS